MNCSLPGSSVHGILQVRILARVTRPYSRGSSWLRDRICISYVSALAGRFFTISCHQRSNYNIICLYVYIIIWASLVAQMVKHPPAMQETWVLSLGWEDPLEKEMAAHSSILPWKIPWTEKPGGLESTGLQRVGHDWATNTHTCPYECVFYSISSL